MAQPHDHRTPSTGFPRDPIDVLVDPLKRFLHIETASGIVLLTATVVALVLANTSLKDAFLGIWSTKAGFSIGDFTMKYSLQHWINDLLMAVFFFVIGLEVKREIVMGELRDLRRASLPLFAAIGGMIIPAGIFLLLQGGTPGERGWGIPMATDIAFVVGCLALLGPRVPAGLRVLLLSLAIADDIGAILVIAIGYTESLDFGALLLGLAGVGLFVAFLKAGVRNTAVFVLIALFIWFEFHESGIHATIAGVIVGLLTPTTPWIGKSTFSEIVHNTLHFMQGDDWRSSHDHFTRLRTMEVATRKSLSPLQRLENQLHPWVGFAIMPVFALANAGVPVEPSSISDPVAVAVALGLLIGKPLGIFGFSWISVRVGLAALPDNLNWKMVFGGACLAGIGFTMALFIASLALSGDLLNAAKVGILIGSALSAIGGFIILLISLPRPGPAQT